MEIKNFAFELKADADSRTVEGLGSVFHNVDGGGDIVLPGAFAKSIASRKPAMLWQHKSDQVIGVWDEVRETPEGLYVKGRILNTALGNDAYELAKPRGAQGHVDRLRDQTERTRPEERQPPPERAGTLRGVAGDVPDERTRGHYPCEVRAEYAADIRGIPAGGRKL